MKQSVLILAVFPAILFGGERPPQPLDPVGITVEAERMILPLGLQPYMFQSANGTLVLQAQVSRTIAYPGVWKTVRSTDHGQSWHSWSPAKGQGEGPFTEGNVGQVLLRLAKGPRIGRFIVPMRTGRVTPIHQTESDDEGKTWTKARPLAFNGVNPDLIEMKSGLLVAGFGWRSRAESERKIVPRHEYKKDPKGKVLENHDRKPSVDPNQGNYLAFSLDQGSSWAQVTKVTTGRNGDYVTLREVQPDNLLLVYNNEAKEAVGRLIRVLRKGTK